MIKVKVVLAGKKPNYYYVVTNRKVLKGSYFNKKIRAYVFATGTKTLANKYANAVKLLYK